MKPPDAKSQKIPLQGEKVTNYNGSNKQISTLYAISYSDEHFSLSITLTRNQFLIQFFFSTFLLFLLSLGVHKSFYTI